MSPPAYVIHWVQGLAPGHTPRCGAADGMGSLLPQLVTCAACKTLLETSDRAVSHDAAKPARRWRACSDTPAG